MEMERIPLGVGYAMRAMEVAFSGGHSIFLYGPPGVGKTTLADAFVSATQMDAPQGARYTRVEFRTRVIDCMQYQYDPAIVVTGWLCPCGGLAAQPPACTCPLKWRRKFANMLWSRVRPYVQMQCRVAHAQVDEWLGEPEPMHAIASRIKRAWERQIKRQERLNAEIPLHYWLTHVGEATRNLLRIAVRQYSWAPRDVENALQVARTIADLAGSDTIAECHLLEAAQYVWSASRHANL